LTCQYNLFGFIFIYHQKSYHCDPKNMVKSTSYKLGLIVILICFILSVKGSNEDKYSRMTDAEKQVARRNITKKKKIHYLAYISHFLYYYYGCTDELLYVMLWWVSLFLFKPVIVFARKYWLISFHKSVFEHNPLIFWIMIILCIYAMPFAGTTRLSIIYFIFTWRIYRQINLIIFEQYGFFAEFLSARTNKKKSTFQNHDVNKNE